MTTGYWVSGTTTNRTKVHLVDDGGAICGFWPRTRKTWQGCAMGVHLDLVECKKCIKVHGKSAPLEEGRE